jgi:hypothetical protein
MFEAGAIDLGAPVLEFKAKASIVEETQSRVKFVPTEYVAPKYS